ncbi:MAG: hypothetical protein K5668_11620 [Lachnospiraceae bacterium]|nr:hypothetical protein [Lachnospiraceae bacterium]
MQTCLNKVSFLAGNPRDIEELKTLPPMTPFSDEAVSLLNDVSKLLMKNRAAKGYPDVITIAFWIRKNSVLSLRSRFIKDDSQFRIGRGVAFHIAPSNVPVNFAYSLAAGILSGNINIVRIPSKDFEQVSLIADAINNALSEHPEFKGYINLVRYERDREINDLFSAMADIRIIWGGDNTIAELRRSPLKPRATEITFADRYSVAVIDSGFYLEAQDKKRIAEDFYNDTFLTDQNACTSPRIVIWTGGRVKEAKEIFWEEERKIVKERYGFQPIQAVNKLNSALLLGAAIPGCRVLEHEDNLIIRISVDKPSPELMDYRDNSGFFFEYDCQDIMEIRPLLNDSRCQTAGYIGEKEMFMPLIRSGIRGTDRIVPVGRTMDFDLVWDGYDLVSAMSREITVL